MVTSASVQKYVGTDLDRCGVVLAWEMAASEVLSLNLADHKAWLEEAAEVGSESQQCSGSNPQRGPEAAGHAEVLPLEARQHPTAGQEELQHRSGMLVGEHPVASGH